MPRFVGFAALRLKRIHHLGYARIKLADPDAMLRRNRYWLAQPELEGFVKTGVAGAALAFIGDENDRPVGGANMQGELLVGGRDAAACVDHEQDDVAGKNGIAALVAHARGDGALLRLFQPRRVG